MNLTRIAGFDWDAGNAEKNAKHGVARYEVEQVFANSPLLVAADEVHSQVEERFAALGITDEGRRLAIAFTFREEHTRIRPISARPMNRKERVVYEEAT
jgi:uncharacterized DUF497 family protein